MLITLDTPYADTTAAELSFARDLPELPALHVLEVPAAGLTLRLLGASHQVVIGGRCVETVACLPGRPAGLPSAVEDDGYAFGAQVHRLAPEELAAAVADLRDGLAGDPYALVGEFPGVPDAVTALAVNLPGEGALGWRTWHAYPQSGEMVSTWTVVRAA